MLYSSAQEWSDAAAKRVLIFAMSGLGKTYVSNMLRESGDWFHYSVDFRIGTRYMGEHIVDNFKTHAMSNPFLADLLRTDSIYIASNITFENLAPLSTYLGKPGDASKGGLPFDEYMRRQSLHREAEKAALLDTEHFMARAKTLYGYDNFVCDTGGSICEVVDPHNPNDPILTELAKNHLLVWIEGSDDHTAELIRRFDRAPKPMYYQPEFLIDAWGTYLDEHNIAGDAVDPDAFVRWTYARALSHRQPRYAAIAKNWGVTVKAHDMAKVTSASDFENLIADTLAAR